MIEAVRPQAAVDGSAALSLSSATAVRWQTKCGYFGLSRHLSVSMSLSLAALALVVFFLWLTIHLVRSWIRGARFSEETRRSKQ
jgi:hypothetical protein